MRVSAAGYTPALVGLPEDGDARILECTGLFRVCRDAE